MPSSLLVFILFAVLLSLHLHTFLMFFKLVYIILDYINYERATALLVAALQPVATHWMRNLVIAAHSN